MAQRPPLTAGYFDSWYADMAACPAKDEIAGRHLGLPPHLRSTSSVPWTGIGEILDRLDLRPGDILLDLACGRAGYGLEIAARADARLVGVDFSPEAVRQAREPVHARAGEQGRANHFVVGDLTATGLARGVAHAAVCLDSIQFADPPDAAYAELRRVLVPGGRAVLTCWEPVEQGDERLVERLRRVDLRAGLTAAGFEQVAVAPRPAWRALERAFWQEAAALEPGDDPALRSLHDEGIRSLATFDLVTRVMASATAPTGD
jgi:SAM-dependent methyltransferase